MLPPMDMDMICTPSSIAFSIAANMSVARQPPCQHTLYAAILAPGAIPRAVPDAYPRRLAPVTAEPAAVLAVWVPWPISSLGDLVSTDSSIVPKVASYPL
uniref:Uncharacterized protein n=1 Tax=Opuntia streptacantha TaxID=393608 RepID=A0A7C9EQ57_OPUST